MKLFVISALLLLPILAHAQSTHANADSASGSASYSQSGSSGSNLSYTSTSDGHYAASTIAPDITSITSDACALGGGASANGGNFFALGLALDRTDKRCGNEADAAGWHALGNDTMAQAMMCQTPTDAKAYLAAMGTPCPGQPGYQPAAFPQVPAKIEQQNNCVLTDPTNPQHLIYIKNCQD
jgi:hypothetical protein